MIHQMDHRWATYENGTARDGAMKEKANPDWEPVPRYWVPGDEVEARLGAKGWRRGWLMGWRDIASATDERTTISAVIPRVAVGHVMPLFFVAVAPNLWGALLAKLDALPLDFVARQKVGGTHLTYGYIKQLPILPPGFYTPERLAYIPPCPRTHLHLPCAGIIRPRFRL
ncbi:hypothetical protein R3X27_23325 [Tropicimonas sp. TH_r6]|uniref:hypothetical protein n=1 Tax=Tropicimonas sp. TH_r6 TaxID=3082085 RepID=UPI002954446F|nr:hypothetical protein [Tropicimonas sp. TH_r6]MDV7145625.1 hypothetical protein [Tropicimonas sp. TH_r6]